MDKVDVIIPLGTGSKSNDDELRLMLRSLEKYGRNYRDVVVVAAKPPAWLQGVRMLAMDDPYKHNKDGNMLRKVTAAMALDYISKEVVTSSDDIVFLQPFDLATLPPIYNRRGRDAFDENGNIWQRRVRRTFDYLEKQGVVLQHNFESHTPHRYNVRKLLRALASVDYQGDIGYSIATICHGMLGITEGWEQGLFKETLEKPGTAKLNKMLLGYNDSAFLGGLREQLYKVFNKPSKYEKDK